MKKFQKIIFYLFVLGAISTFIYGGITIVNDLLHFILNHGKP